jgi:hypothetical protein
MVLLSGFVLDALEARSEEAPRPRNKRRQKILSHTHSDSALPCSPFAW